MASSEEMRRLVLHAADRLDGCKPMANAHEVRRLAAGMVTKDINAIEGAYVQAVRDAVAIASAITVLRMVAACMAVEEEADDAQP